MNQAELLHDLLPSVSQAELSYSAGFSASKPERWVPTLGNYWWHFFELLQIDFKIIDVKPSFSFGECLSHFYHGASNDCKFALALDAETNTFLQHIIADDADSSVLDIGVEYLICRFFASLSESWSGADFQEVKYQQYDHSLHFIPTASVQITANINSRKCVFEILLDEQIVSKLNGLWSRQTSTIQYSGTEDQACYLRLAILPEDALQADTFHLTNLDLNQLELVHDSDVFSCNLCRMENKLILKMNPRESKSAGELSTPLELVSSEFAINSAHFNLLSRSGTLIPTNLELNCNLFVKQGKDVLRLLELSGDGKDLFLMPKNPA